MPDSDTQPDEAASDFSNSLWLTCHFLQESRQIEFDGKLNIITPWCPVSASADACMLEATPEPSPPLRYQTVAMKSSLLPGRIFTPHQPTHNLHLSFLFFFFLSLLVGRACLVAPQGSDYSSDRRASTCRSLQSGEGGFCSVAAPTSDGDGTA